MEKQLSSELGCVCDAAELVAEMDELAREAEYDEEHWRCPCGGFACDGGCDTYAMVRREERERAWYEERMDENGDLLPEYRDPEPWQEVNWDAGDGNNDWAVPF